jgi:hypothetical protein
MEAGPVSAALPQAVHAQQLEELPSVLTAVAKERQPDDIVLIEAWATKAFPLYANKLHFRSNGVYVIVGAKTGCDDAAFLRRTGFADHRVWLITSSQYRIRPDFNAAELAHFTLLSRISKTIVRTGAAAYLLEPDPSATHAPADPKKCAFLLWNPPA